MKELTKTLAFVGVALLLTGAAFLRIPDRSGSNLAFDDQGQPFFPNFKEPFACTDLQVVEYEPTTAMASEFLVKLKDGKWVIPSHYDYPADAKDRLAKTASGVMDLVKDTIRSDRAEDQEPMGVIDPTDAKATSLKGRGKRVTLRDTSEKVLAEFIIGNEIKSDHSGQRYVRIPGQKRIYGVKVNVDLSTKFADWIETNLLKVDNSKIRKIVFDNHKVDTEQGTIVPGDVITIERKDGTAPWTIQGGVPADKELDTDKLTALTTALSDLKIVGVRTKPPGLSRDLKLSTTGDLKLKGEQALKSLFSKGFYPVRSGGLVSNQGDVLVYTDEGVVYTLRYGEVVLASGLELTAGTDESAAAKTKDGEKKAPGATENRYLLVTASFDPSLIPVPEAEPKSTELVIPADPFQKAPDDPKRIAEEKEEKDKADRKKADHDKKIADGEKRVKDLTDRFADWYYVTPGDSFKSIVLDRAAMIRIKNAKPDVPAIPGGGFPGGGFPGGMPGGVPGLPPGFQHP